MLLTYGMGINPADWHVLEKKPPMYARVYDILGGETVYYGNGRTIPLQKGHLYIFPIYEPYEMTTNPENPIHCLHLHLDILNSNLRNIIDIPLDNDPQMANLMQAFADGIAASSPFLYLEHLSIAFETLCLSRGLFARLDACADNYLRVIRTIYRSNTTLESAAGLLGYSTGHFNRCFKAKFGVSPHQYIISLRMSDAIRMLASNMPLDTIGCAVGYADGQSFSNAFRKYYGISPSDYRKNYAGNA